MHFAVMKVPTSRCGARGGLCCGRTVSSTLMSAGYVCEACRCVAEMMRALQSQKQLGELDLSACSAVELDSAYNRQFCFK